jgi:hypothetical protein
MGSGVPFFSQFRESCWSNKRGSLFRLADPPADITQYLTVQNMDF